ncbi:MAG: hypothetical protein DRJ42_31400 [Deltaproteobacteria bacterium]|nr:MAG: hypothetical protein DRJ42_31400 [Deltaproteobacteria bacterium]
MRYLSLGLVLFSLSWIAPWAPAAEAQNRRSRAQPEQEPDGQERAVELAQQALEHYHAGEPEEAIPLLLEARELYPEPLLLYNLARAYEATGETEAALAAYEQYVEERPDAPDRAAMESHIDSLREQLRERERLAQEHEEERRRREAAEARAEEESGAGPWPWVLIGTGGAALGAGVVFGLLAQSERDNAASDPVHETTVAGAERADTFAIVANVLFVAGGVLAATGLVWVIVEGASGGGGDDEDGADGDAALAVAPTPTGVLLRGAW